MRGRRRRRNAGGDPALIDELRLTPVARRVRAKPNVERDDGPARATIDEMTTFDRREGQREIGDHQHAFSGSGRRIQTTRDIERDHRCAASSSPNLKPA